MDLETFKARAPLLPTDEDEGDDEADFVDEDFSQELCEAMDLLEDAGRLFDWLADAEGQKITKERAKEMTALANEIYTFLHTMDELSDEKEEG